MTYDRAHRLVSGSHANRFGNQTQAYTYDSAGQITSAVRTGSGAGTETFSYDTGGNRTNANGTVYTNTNNNRIVSDTIFNYYYDDEGNLIRRIALVGGQPTGWTRDFQWDQHNRLLSVTDRYGGPTAPVSATYTYRYDSFDRRVRATSVVNFPSFSSKDQFFYYDGEDVSLTTGTPLENARYLHGPAVDEVLAREEAGGSTLDWVYTDHLGSVRDVMAGNFVSKHMDFNLFGGLQGGSNAWYYGFTSREYDHNTGLNYHRARWLDSWIGRWINEDPIGFAGGDANLNRYVGNQVTGFTDANGLQSLRSRANAEIDDWAYGTSTGCSAFDSSTAAAGSIAGSLAKPFVWLWTHWRSDTERDRVNAILRRQAVVNRSREMGAWTAGLNLYAGATTDRIAYGLVQYDPIAERSLSFSESVENIASGTSGYAGTWIPGAGVASRIGTVGTGVAARFPNYMHFRRQGFTPAQANYLSKPYRGEGHHFPIR